MQLEMTHPYPASVGQVLDAFFDQSHILAKNERLGARAVRVIECLRDQDVGKLIVEREMTTTANVPGLLSGFHREWNSVRQEEHWFCEDAGEWHCEFRVQINQVPAKIQGYMRLQGEDQQCTNHISLTVQSDVPLLGKKIAQFLIEDMEHKIGQEHRVTRDLLQRAG